MYVNLFIYVCKIKLFFLCRSGLYLPKPMYLKITKFYSVLRIILKLKKFITSVEATIILPVLLFITVSWHMPEHLTQLMANGWENQLRAMLHHKESNIQPPYVSKQKKTLRKKSLLIDFFFKKNSSKWWWHFTLRWNLVWSSW